MKLKRLELYGYKSFASRAVFLFDEGITAVVGPNGSGKSNIADAVRWVMGEQSYTSMRAKTTEDMIFAGSKTRSRLGMAEVMLVFDNSSGWLPLEYAEVSVGRRAFRSGENEYLLNGAKVRYRDILDLFGGAGLARSNYTVIGQGMVDAALALRPEARRALFEEAAGITPQLRKRDETLQRIVETERNLQRVADIAQELEPRVRSLRRQAERAQDQAILRQDLRELERIWYGYQWQRISAQLTRAQLLGQEHQQQQEMLRAAMRELDEQRETAEGASDSLRQELEALSIQYAGNESRITGLNRETAVSAERLRLYESQQHTIQQELESLITQRDVVQHEVEHTSSEFTEQELSLRVNQAELDATKAAHAQAEAERRRLTGDVSQEQKKANQIGAVLAEVRARLDQAAERRVELEQALKRGDAALQSAREKIDQSRANQETLATQEQLLGRELEETQQEHARLEQALQEALANSRQVEQRRTLCETKLEGLLARQEMQSRLRQELPGYHPGVREVLAGKVQLNGLLGTVASLMTVPSEYEEAIESALGTRLQNIVASKWEDAEAAINHLRTSGAGWATFLPLDTIRARPPARIRPEAGVIGIASGLVSFEEHLRLVFELLLGSVLVVRDLTAARRLLKSSMGISLFVTVGGETVQPSGALSGGARRNNANLLAQERLCRELSAQIKAARAELNNVAHEAELAESARQNAQAALLRADEGISAKRTELEALRNRLAGSKRELRDTEAELAWLQTRRQRDADEATTLATRAADLIRQQAGYESEQLSTMERLRTATERLSAQDDNLRQQLASLETRVAVGQRTVRSQRVLVESHRANLAQICAQIEQKRKQVTDLDELLGRQHSSHAQADLQLAQLRAQNDVLEQRMVPLRTSIAEHDHTRQEAEHNRASLQERFSVAAIDADRTLRELDRLKEEQQSVRDELASDLGQILPRSVEAQQLSLDLGGTIVQLPVVPVMPEGLDEQLRALRASIRRSGDVNPDAPAEFAEAHKRLEFMRTQDHDLRTAIVSLQQVIKELEQLIDYDLRRTFSQVQKAFGSYFSLLFSGGSAELELTNPDNLSETGIEITARPPGKRAQSLSLLSGGERALTAVALLFALLEVNPVPFCFLDEVDAALDEANIFRFRELLQRHAVNTQFVVITHNRRTIETATSIYGIAMGEQGVSQVISLKVSDESATTELT